jgi:hypothetical protein
MTTNGRRLNFRNARHSSAPLNRLTLGAVMTSGDRILTQKGSFDTGAKHVCQLPTADIGKLAN